MWVQGPQGVELVVVRVKANRYMYHQIRNMMGLAMLVLQSGVEDPTGYFNQAFHGASSPGGQPHQVLTLKPSRRWQDRHRYLSRFRSHLRSLSFFHLLTVRSAYCPVAPLTHAVLAPNRRGFGRARNLEARRAGRGVAAYVRHGRSKSS